MSLALRIDETGPGTAPAPVPSFDEVYEEHVDFVWRSARGLGIPASALEDVVQDVFVVVHRRLAEFEGRATLRTWITRILFNIVREHRRRFARTAGHAPIEIDPPDPRAPSPADEAERGEAARLLAEILDGMDDEQREVFVLSEIEELPMPEVAAALGINTNTAYSRLRLARRTYERHLTRVRAQNAWRTK